MVPRRSLLPSLACALLFLVSSCEGDPASSSSPPPDDGGSPQAGACGDGAVQDGEVCDGASVACDSLGLGAGDAACRADCSGYDTATCSERSQAGGPKCGNRLREEGETCDYEQMPCSGLGLGDGNAVCRTDCQGWDTSTCSDGGGPPPGCGDGVRGVGEACDYEQVPCSHLGLGEGSAICRDDCSGFDASGCTPPASRCGDGARDAGEVCDGGTKDCRSFASFDAGTATCRADCAGWDTSACSGPVCGDGVREGAEVCDREAVSCQTFGYRTGAAVCRPDCSGFDTSTCGGTPSGGTCGNGVRDSGEVCDTETASCAAWGMPNGTATCRADCSGWDLSACSGPYCGDGRIDGDEACDGGGVPCSTFGLGSGDAPCRPDCTGFETSACSGGAAVCGNGVRETGEACDGDTIACTVLGAYTDGDATCRGDCTGYDRARCETTACTPQCAGRECGSDGCGGTCGACTGDATCAEATGRCVAPDAVTWTVLVYMLADNNLDPGAVLDLIEMREVRSNGRLRFVVLVDRIRDEDPERRFEVPGLGFFDDARLLVIEDGDLDVVSSPGEIDMGNPEILRAFIADGLSNWPADRTALVLWDHGGGASGYGGDDTNGSPPMSLPQVGAAIRGGIQDAGAGRFDLLGFDACLMATYATAATLRPYARYLLASEEEEPGHGWDWRSFGVVNSTPGADVPLVARAVIDGFLNQAREWNKHHKVTLSVLDLDRIPAVGNALNALRASIGAAMPASLATAFGRARAQADEYGSDNRQVDLSHLLQLWEAPADVRAAADQVRNAVDAAVDSYANGPAHSVARGLAVHFPRGDASLGVNYASIPAGAAWNGILTAFETPLAGDSVGPRFTNPDGLADTQDLGEVLRVSGTLAAASVPDIADARLYFGILDGDFVYFFGDYPAGWDAGGTVAGEWDRQFLYLGEGEEWSPVYVQMDVDVDAEAIYLTVPLAYAPSGGTDIALAYWQIGYDLSSGEPFSGVMYLVDDSGAVSELQPSAGSLVYATVLVASDTGTEFQFMEPGFDPATVTIEFAPLQTGAEALLLLNAYDAAGNVGSVYGLWTF